MSGPDLAISTILLDLAFAFGLCVLGWIVVHFQYIAAALLAIPLAAFLGQLGYDILTWGLSAIPLITGYSLAILAATIVLSGLLEWWNSHWEPIQLESLKSQLAVEELLGLIQTRSNAKYSPAF